MGFVKYMSEIMVENPLPVGGFLYELSLIKWAKTWNFIVFKEKP